MCSCSVKVGSKSDVIPGQITGIPVNGVLKKDFFTLLAWAWCINEDKVKAAFKQQSDLDIDSNDFVTLVKGHESGNDVKVHGVDFMKLITDLKFTQDEMEKASCKTILTR